MLYRALVREITAVLLICHPAMLQSIAIWTLGSPAWATSWVGGGGMQAMQMHDTSLCYVCIERPHMEPSKLQCAGYIKLALLIMLVYFRYVAETCCCSADLVSGLDATATAAGWQGNVPWFAGRPLPQYKAQVASPRPISARPHTTCMPRPTISTRLSRPRVTKVVRATTRAA